MRIVVLRTDRLGELLLTLPVVSALRHEANAHVTMVVRDEYAELVRLCPDVNEVSAVAWPGGRLRWRDTRALIPLLRSGHFDAAIVANPSKWLHWAVWRAGIPRRIGYDHKWSWCLTDRLADDKVAILRHEAEWNLELAKPLGIAGSPSQVTIAVPETLKQRMRERLMASGVASGHRLVALHPWASTLEKRWPVASFQAVARQLTAEHGISIVIIGGREHADEAAQFCREAGPVINLTAGCDLPELAACLQHCQLLISNDSGPVHLAAVVGTPTVTLSGSPHPWQGPGRWRPWGEEHTVLHRVPIDAIQIQEVVQAVHEHLSLCRQ